MDIELCRWGRLVIVMMFCTLSSWGQRLDVRSVGQLEARQYERGNGRGGCSRVSMGHVNVFTGWLIDGPNIPGRPFWVMRHRTPLLT